MPSWQTCRHPMLNCFLTSWLCTWVEGVWIKNSLVPCCRSMCVYHTRCTKCGSWPCSVEAVECMKCKSEPSQWAGKEGNKLAFLEHGRLISSVPWLGRVVCVCGCVSEEMTLQIYLAYLYCHFGPSFASPLGWCHVRVEGTKPWHCFVNAQALFGHSPWNSVHS